MNAEVNLWRAVLRLNLDDATYGLTSQVCKDNFKKTVKRSIKRSYARYADPTNDVFIYNRFPSGEARRNAIEARKLYEGDAAWVSWFKMMCDFAEVCPEASFDAYVKLRDEADAFVRDIEAFRKEHCKPLSLDVLKAKEKVREKKSLEKSIKRRRMRITEKFRKRLRKERRYGKRKTKV